MNVYFIHTGDLTLRRCGCPQRQQAQREEEFFYVPLHHGYVWKDSVPDAPPRLTGALKGKPVVFTTCPFCGADLP